MMMKSSIESAVKGVPQTVGSKTRAIIVCDCFGCWEFSFLDPIH